jgi:hypothetical protein
LTAGIAILLSGGARAGTVDLTGSISTAGDYSSSGLAAAANSSDTVSFNGLTGITLWGLLGGANSSSPTSPTYGAITTSTPAGDNGKNAILRDYVVATGSNGAQSVVSLGEIDPAFGGTAAVPAFIAFQATGGSLLGTPMLVVPGASGRTVSSLTNLQLLSVPALPTGPGGVSTSLTVSGLTSNSGVYTLAALQSSFTSVQQTVGGNTCTGIPLVTLINLSSPTSIARSWWERRPTATKWYIRRLSSPTMRQHFSLCGH